MRTFKILLLTPLLFLFSCSSELDEDPAYLQEVEVEQRILDCIDPDPDCDEIVQEINFPLPDYGPWCKVKVHFTYYKCIDFFSITYEIGEFELEYPFGGPINTCWGLEDDIAEAEANGTIDAFNLAMNQMAYAAINAFILEQANLNREFFFTQINYEVASCSANCWQYIYAPISPIGQPIPIAIKLVKVKCGEVCCRKETKYSRFSSTDPFEVTSIIFDEPAENCTDNPVFCRSKKGEYPMPFSPRCVSSCARLDWGEGPQ